MRADSDQHENLRLDGPAPVGRISRLLHLLPVRVAQLREELRVLQFIERRLGALDNENRPRSPQRDHPLAGLELADVDVDGAGRGDGGRVRIHLVDERPDRRRDADRSQSPRRQKQEVPLRDRGASMAFRSRVGTHRHSAPLQTNKRALDPNHGRMKLNGASAFVYPPPSPLATPRSPQTLLALDFAWRLDDDPAGVEIDAWRDAFRKRQKQSSPPPAGAISRTSPAPWFAEQRHGQAASSASTASSPGPGPRSRIRPRWATATGHDGRRFPRPSRPPRPRGQCR